MEDGSKKEDPAYVKIVHYKESDGGDNGGGGRGGESKKQITKGELMRPLEEMAGQFSQLHDYIGEKNVKAVNYLTGTMTDTFVKLQEYARSSRNQSTTSEATLTKIVT